LCNVTLRGRKSRHGYPEEPSTIGEHIKRRRLDRGLLQRDIAVEIGCSEASLLNWERGRAEPEVRFIPSVLRFLGYDPRPAPLSFGERIKRKREGQGISQRELARRLDVDQATVWAWETGQVRRLYPRLIRLFEEYLEEL
jgi:transcriptional regulator with XRE-family HTH domain